MLMTAAKTPAPNIGTDYEQIIGGIRSLPKLFTLLQSLVIIIARCAKVETARD